MAFLMAFKIKTLFEKHKALIYSVLAGFFLAFTYAITKYTLGVIPEYTNFRQLEKSIYLLLLANISIVIILSIYYISFILKLIPKETILKKKYFQLSFFIGLTSTLGTFFLYRCIDNNPISVIVPIIGGVLGLSIILFAKYIFEEDITSSLLFGIVLIGLGIFMTNRQISIP